MYSSTSPLELQQTATVIYPTLKTKAVTRTSIILIVCGVLSVILQIASLSIDLVNFNYPLADIFCAGIWGGATYIVAGATGLAGSSKRSRPLLVTSTVFCSFAIPDAIIGAFFGLIDGIDTLYAEDVYCRYTSYSHCHSYAALELTLMVIAVVVFFVSITQLVFLSSAVCCSRKKTNTAAVPHVVVHVAADQ